MFLLKSKLNKKVRALQNVGIVKINDAENYANELKKYDIYDDIILSGAKFYNAHLHLVDDFYYGLIYCFTDNSVILAWYLCFHSQVFSINFSLPKFFLSIPCFFSSLSTTFWVAIPA